MLWDTCETRSPRSSLITPAEIPEDTKSPENPSGTLRHCSHWRLLPSMLNSTINSFFFFFFLKIHFLFDILLGVYPSSKTQGKFRLRKKLWYEWAPSDQSDRRNRRHCGRNGVWDLKHSQKSSGWENSRMLKASVRFIPAFCARLISHILLLLPSFSPSLCILMTVSVRVWISLHHSHSFSPTPS